MTPAAPTRRCGRSGLKLPAISLGLWHNFGHDRAWTTQQEICRRAFDLGVTHFDLANNYGPPYGAAETNFGRILSAELKVPLLIHQPSYSMLNRWTEDDQLLDTLDDLGVGCIAFSPLAQGLLTNRYLNGIPADSRAATGGALRAESITEEKLARVRSLGEVAARRGQSLAQLALVWALRDPRMTSVVIRASSVEQLDDNIAALANTALSVDELAEIDRHAVDAGINLWQGSSDQ